MTITLTQAAAFLPTIIANSALERLRLTTVLPRLVSTDADYTGAFTVGQTLNIPFLGAVVANQKTAGNPVTVQSPNSGQVTVTLNQHWEVTTVIEDIVQAMENQSIMNRFIENAVQALAEQLETSIFAAMDSGATIAVGNYTNDLSYATVLAARQAMNQNRVPLLRRNLVISPKDETALKSDAALQAYFSYGQSQVTQGSIGRLEGFDVYVSQAIPTANAGQDVNNFAWHPSGVLLVMRQLPAVPPDFGARQEVVRDPETGLAMRATMAYLPNQLAVQVTLDMLWGVALTTTALNRQGLVVRVRS
ncbi:MAG: hypothetical protein KatS3mg105_5280 [Gemmatales bacterium]|nr:MAG: hypothetical protein KatS3mg105_5280 [Gemmatales bacterium]